MGGECLGAHVPSSAQLRTRGVGSSSSSKMVIFMTQDLCCLIESLHDTADLPDLSGSTRLAESFTDIPGSFPSSLPMGSTGNGPKPAPQEA